MRVRSYWGGGELTADDGGKNARAGERETGETVVGRTSGLKLQVSAFQVLIFADD
jgi:hypothetical protein